MSRLTNVECYHSGGGVFSYTALFNNEVYLAGDLDGDFESYDAPYGDVERDLDSNGDYQFKKHKKKPSVPFPIWQEILDSIRDNCDPFVVNVAEEIFSSYGKRMNEPCID